MFFADSELLADLGYLCCAWKLSVVLLGLRSPYAVEERLQACLHLARVREAQWVHPRRRYARILRLHRPHLNRFVLFSLSFPFPSLSPPLSNPFPALPTLPLPTGEWPITLGSTTTRHAVYLSEENHFDVVLGRSFMERRSVKTDNMDLTNVVCMDTGEKIDCEVVIIRDGKGEYVTVT